MNLRFFPQILLAAGLFSGILARHLPVFSQNAFQQEYGYEQYGFTGAVMRPQGGCLLVNNLYDNWGLVLTDKLAQTVWTRTSTEDGHIYLQHMLLTHDSGALLLGRFDDRALLIRLNSGDEIQWTRMGRSPTIPGSVCFFEEAVEDQDGNFYAIGYDAAPQRSFLVKLNENGQYCWARECIGPGHRLAGLLARSDGNLILAGTDGADARVWVLDPAGQHLSSHNMAILGYGNLVAIDLVENTDLGLTFLLTTGNAVIHRFALAKVNASWLLEQAGYYSWMHGFRSLNGLEHRDDRYYVFGNIVNPGDPFGPSPPYHMFTGVIDSSGVVAGCMRYHGDHTFTGYTDHLMTPDRGVLLCGYAGEQDPQDTRSFLVKVDSSLFSGCYEDSVGLLYYPFPVSIGPSADVLNVRSDSLSPLQLSLSVAPDDPVNRLCYMGIQHIGTDPALVVYPNPAGDQVAISFPGGNHGDVRVCILDLNGRVVRDYLVSPAADTYRITTASLQPGCYLLRWFGVDNVVNQLFVKL